MEENEAISFEIFGKVQRVYFRKETQRKATELGVVGWCGNTKTNTVIGEAYGNKYVIEIFKQWLSEEGSPTSKIEKANFQQIHVGHSLSLLQTMTLFEVRKLFKKERKNKF